MLPLFFYLALFLYLIATGGLIVYIVRQHRWIFVTSFWFLFAGFAFHTVFLVLRSVALGAIPVLDLKSAFSFFSWCVVFIYLLFHKRFGLMVLGAFAAPLASLLMIISSAMTWPTVPVSPLFKSSWLAIHVITIFLGDALFAMAFLAAAMYLIQERQIKRKNLGFMYKRLPSLATLDSINYHSLIYGFPLLTIGMITGSIYAQLGLGTYWQWDPKEVWSLITWLFYAALLHERLAVGWRGRRAAIMSIICFGLLLFTFIGAGLWMGGYHSFGSLGGRQAL